MHVQVECPVKIQTSDHYLRGKPASGKLGNMTNHFAGNRLMLNTLVKVFNQNYYKIFATEAVVLLVPQKVL